MENSGAARAPWHLWVVGVLTLIWNAFGAYDYSMTQMRNEEYLGQAAEGAGVPLQVMLDYFTNFPVWADAAWALGVWGAVAGSALLLIRNRFAYHAFLVSLLGLAGTTVFTLKSDIPAELDNSFTWIFTAVIWATIIALAYYARRMTARGVLK
ncbi:hypothetical protein IM511_04780 [Erythrobacteraceae bacterium E2-1 Yellow Sea]|nr:hypothetical protein [Erythrobacteraceae bacterium E2-1 Yellow Sea]